MTPTKDIFSGIIVFTQVVQAGGFSAAAEVMGHSTSYIRKTINASEQRLHTRLLNRTTRTISLTPEGESYYQQCLALIDDANEATDSLHQHTIEPAGELRISCPSSFGVTHLHPILSLYAQQYPKVQLTLDLNDRKVDVIEEGFDIAIRATNQLSQSNLICRKIYSSVAYTIASPTYLEKYGRPTKPEELKAHACICYSNLAIPTRWHYQGLKQEDLYIDVTPKVLCNNASMQLAMTVDGHGISRLPAFAMEQALADRQVEILFPQYVNKTIDVYALYPSRKHLSAKVRLFIELITQHLR